MRQQYGTRRVSYAKHRFGRRPLNPGRAKRKYVTLPPTVSAGVHDNQTSADWPPGRGEPDKKPSAKVIATAILEGPNRIRQKELPAWTENIENWKPHGTPAGLDTVIAPHAHGPNPSIDGNDESFSKYSRALLHRRKTSDLLQCLSDLTSRQLGERSQEPTDVQGHKRDQNHRKGRLRIADMIMTTYKIVLRQRGKVAGALFDCLAGKWTPHSDVLLS